MLENQKNLEPGSQQQSKLSPKPLAFKPVTEGLGFHPFSDGLPYAPVTRAQSPHPPVVAAASMAYVPTPASVTLGSGAVAAGPARYSIPNQTSLVAPALKKATAVATAAKAAQLSAETATEYTWGYLARRVTAYTVDLFLNLGVCVLSMGAVFYKQHLPKAVLLSPSVLPFLILFALFFHWALTTAQEVALHTTVGKNLFGLKIEGSVTSIFLRAFFFVPSVAFFGTGLLWALFNREKRCWHDSIVDLQPEIHPSEFQ